MGMAAVRGGGLLEHDMLANAATVVLIGAMMLYGLPPGPVLSSHSPQLFGASSAA